MMSLRRGWALSDDRALEDMLRRGATYAEIAEALGRTRKSIYAKAALIREYGGRPYDEPPIPRPPRSKAKARTTNRRRDG